jgi:hypothetical protein
MRHQLTQDNEEERGRIALPGLARQVIEGLAPLYRCTLTADTRQPLRMACGMVGSALADIDFTGRWYPEQPPGVLSACLSLALDGKNRRWVAGTAGNVGFPGPVWYVFPHPPVAVYVGDDLIGFVSALREAEESDQHSVLTAGFTPACVFRCGNHPVDRSSAT